ncbi:MBL fold metallo-hydrolase [Desulfatiglans anilini]|uniref:MBL fold metallo-hydrolase n=1 Tax=Desulfatiglans anilini TaxID=90728 RepID=UPI001FC9ACEA|nr:MBL fold metallo-hydrolase [Desulfatiglans anilini]
MGIPKPLCECGVCSEARHKGGRYRRTGPSAFIHDEHVLIDTPAEICEQINRCGLNRIDHLLFTHLDPDHVEGFRVVEQMALDFRSWEAYPEKRIRLHLPAVLDERIREIRSIYGPLIDFYERQGYVERSVFDGTARIGGLLVTAIPVNRGAQTAFVLVFENARSRIVYAPCDIKPFPEERAEVQRADLLVIQPGIFEEGLKHGFHYPAGHISRQTLYTFEETLALAGRLAARQVLFVHIEEYWNRGYDDYRVLEDALPNARFAYDGLTVRV